MHNREKQKILTPRENLYFYKYNTGQLDNFTIKYDSHSLRV